MTCEGCVVKRCRERIDNYGCDWKVDVNGLVDILEDYDIEGIKLAVEKLEVRLKCDVRL